MIRATTFAGRAVGIFGLGKAGEASVEALVAGGAEIYAWDDKYNSATPSPAHVHYKDWPWEKLAALVLAPGVPLTHPEPHEVVKLAKKNNVPVIGDIEILYRAQPEAHYVGITGTNGKSTTTTLIGHMLQTAGKKCEVGGNLGTAALSLAPLGKGETYVLETSSYQLDLLQSARFNIAILLNVTPDHLDRHGDMQGYIAAKKHIFARQVKEDVAIIAVDDDYTKAVANELRAGGNKVIEVSSQRALQEGIYVLNGILHDGELRFDLSNIASLTGAHNWQNAVCAYAVGRAMGIAPDAIYAAFKSFAGLRHRLQLVATIRGVRFINDSKATNADAVQHALKPYQNIYWIAGGKAKSGGIESLSPYFSHIKRAYLIGDAEELFAQTLEGKVPVVRSHTLANAVENAAKDAFKENIKDAVVLLSPACASFDQFNSFEHRGDVFCELVEELNAS